MLEGERPCRGSGTLEHLPQGLEALRAGQRSQCYLEHGQARDLAVKIFDFLGTFQEGNRYINQSY